jgi:hypothetical protein
MLNPCVADTSSRRITRMVDGQCIIGMRRIAMIPLISFDALINVSILFDFDVLVSANKVEKVYLTILFLIPLSSQSFQRWPH